MSQVYEWHIDVHKKDFHGKRIATTPAVIFASDKAEVTEKVRAAFNSTESYGGRWSHGWTLREVKEVRPTSIPVQLL